MRAVVQRVAAAAVSVDGALVGAIDHGLVVLLGIARGDGPQEADWLADKVIGLRIFSNTTGKFDHSVRDVDGGVLVISQFTLIADTRKGRRPSFEQAAPPEEAEPLYEHFKQRVMAAGVPVRGGRFGAHMRVQLVNDGPVTIVIDTTGRERQD
jgi:D-tyrosyl-tRNA(Tyr) deacylase